MSFKLSAQVWELDLSPSAKYILLALADYANDSAQCFPSIAALARKTGCSESKVRRQLTALKRVGLITGLSEGGGRAHTNTYQINLGKGVTVTGFIPERASQRQGFENKKGVTLTEKGCQNDRPYNNLSLNLPEKEDGANAPRAQSQQPKAKPASETRAIFALYTTLFTERFGEKPLFDGAKDGANIKRLLTSYGRAKVEQCMRAYFETSDVYIQNAGYPLRLFYSANTFTKLLAEVGDARKDHQRLASGIEGAEQYEDIFERLRREQEERQTGAGGRREEAIT